MANVQHIFTSNADPVGVAPTGSHHINSLSGDIWLYGNEWIRVYVGGSVGSVAFYDSLSAPPSPDHTALKWDGDALKISQDGFWREITLTPEPI